MTPSTTASKAEEAAAAPARAAEQPKTNTKPSKPSQDLKTEAELRARIAELEAQQKRQARAPAARPATQRIAGNSGGGSRQPIDLAESRDWRTVATWGGSGAKTTETFVITGREWRVNWQSGDRAAGGVFQITVKDSADQTVSVAANTTSVGSDSTYLRAKAATYYLVINSTNDNWAVSVQER